MLRRLEKRIYVALPTDAGRQSMFRAHMTKHATNFQLSQNMSERDADRHQREQEEQIAVMDFKTLSNLTEGYSVSTHNLFASLSSPSVYPCSSASPSESEAGALVLCAFCIRLPVAHFGCCVPFARRATTRALISCWCARNLRCAGYVMS